MKSQKDFRARAALFVWANQAELEVDNVADWLVDALAKFGHNAVTDAVINAVEVCSQRSRNHAQIPSNLDPDGIIAARRSESARCADAVRKLIPPTGEPETEEELRAEILRLKDLMDTSKCGACFKARLSTSGHICAIHNTAGACRKCLQTLGDDTVIYQGNTFHGDCAPPEAAR